MNTIHPPILRLALALTAVLFAGCYPSQHGLPATIQTHHGESLGSLEVKDAKFLTLIERTASLEKLASGFDWAEGPVWIKPGQAPVSYGPLSWRQGGYLLFSDVPSNTVYRWKEGEGLSVFLKPSGYTGKIPRGGEPGSNGLTTDSEGRLVLCEHGDRRVGRLEKDGRHVTLADKFMGKRFNSPNDLVYNAQGDLYLTDPPYGLLGTNHDVGKELSFQGVYRLRANGELTLLTDQMSRPNGLALSPDEKILYIANSDPGQAVWMAYDVKADGTIANGHVFFDVTPLVGPGKKGLPDGMKVDRDGNLFATGPGGVFVFSPEGKHLGTINPGEATANCAWGDDGSTLYLTADMFLCRIKTRTKGKGF